MSDEKDRGKTGKPASPRYTYMSLYRVLSDDGLFEELKILLKQVYAVEHELRRRREVAMRSHPY
jgi:hypothetical protein